MNAKEIKELILTIDKTSIQNLEIEENNFKMKISKSFFNYEKAIEIKGEQGVIEESIQDKIEENILTDLDDIYIVKSPIVGAFYSAPSPNSEPFIKVGDYVKKDQPLCIIEAMKIMNEIQSEESGEVVEVLVENEDIVEYGQPLMKIRR